MSRKDRPRMKQAAPVSSLIEDLIQSKGFEGKLQEYRSWAVWDEVVGPTIAARARPVRIRDGILEVRVDQPVWMQQLQLMKPKIIAKLNQHLGEGVLKDLFLRRGTNKPAPSPAPVEKPLAWRDEVLDEAELAEIEKVITTVTEPELKSHLRRIMTRQKKVAKARKKG